MIKKVVFVEISDLNSIIPGVKLGRYFLDWDLDTLKNNLPSDYAVGEDNYCWFVQFGNYTIRIRKADNKIDAIMVKGDFIETFQGKVISRFTLAEIEKNFGYLYDETMFLYLGNYPGMEFYFEDEQPDKEWDQVKLEEILINDPNFVWDKHFTHEDYLKMAKTQYPSPFSTEKMKK